MHFQLTGNAGAWLGCYLGLVVWFLGGTEDVWRGPAKEIRKSDVIAQCGTTREYIRV